MGKNMLVFHNASNTSYANYADNLTSISSATTAVTLRFIGQGASATATSTDAVVLTVTAGKEEEMVELIAGAVAEARSGVTVVADDENSKYLNGNITAVDSISVDTGAGTFKNIIVGAFSSNDIAVTNAQSGSLVTVPTTGANSTITLPSSPVDGANYRFVCEADNGAHTITVAGAFEGIVLDNTHATTLDNTTNVVIAASKFKIGDFFEVVYSGSAGGYKIFGSFITDDAIAAN
tara:strand:- start:51 stop:755 length:705 start_codon:yes stop_codon:yes gene_type:complete